MLNIFEEHFESDRVYADPFNDLEVDAIFKRNGEEWRVPTFWRGAQRWSVRFRPPTPGTYTLHLESNDDNPDLNRDLGQVAIPAYDGQVTLLQRGPLRVSRSGRYFEHVDGTPFAWLGDTWWMGLSTRLPWDGFQVLTADRVAKGFTVVQICGGLVPHERELNDSGFQNEAGSSWEGDFDRINPAYYDFADRRIDHLVKNGIVPAIVGGWSPVLAKMGVHAMKKHWRNLIARYGAYPVFWIAGGEVHDPPTGIAEALPASISGLRSPGWTEVLRHIREIDPYHHPITVHEVVPPLDSSVQDESLTDFDLFQAGHHGWASLAAGIALVGSHYSRTEVTKPVVQGEIGYEGIGATHLADFQRMAFWTAVLNGAAGFTYGTISIATVHPVSDPSAPHVYNRVDPWVSENWREGMNLPGSTQVGLNGRELRRYPWHKFAPHPEWVTPGGTTMLEPRAGISGFDIDLLGVIFGRNPENGRHINLPAGDWQRCNGDFRFPYAAGIPGKVRLVYIPVSEGLALRHMHPTVLRLEPGIRYAASYFDPQRGVAIDLGSVETPVEGPVLFNGTLADINDDFAPVHACQDVRLVIEGSPREDLTIVLRYVDSGSYLSFKYDSAQQILEFIETREGVEGHPLGRSILRGDGKSLQISVEVREGLAMASIHDGTTVTETPIVDVRAMNGLIRVDGGRTDNRILIRGLSPSTVITGKFPIHMVDAVGIDRGILDGERRRNQMASGGVLLNAYRPPPAPFGQDWLLVLERIS